MESEASNVDRSRQESAGTKPSRHTQYSNPASFSCHSIEALNVLAVVYPGHVLKITANRRHPISIRLFRLI